MENKSIIIHSSADMSADVLHLHKQAEIHLSNSKAENTKKAYTSDWQLFIEWCAEHDLVELPATSATTAYYLIFLFCPNGTLNTFPYPLYEGMLCGTVHGHMALRDSCHFSFNRRCLIRKGRLWNIEAYHKLDIEQRDPKT